MLDNHFQYTLCIMIPKKPLALLFPLIDLLLPQIKKQKLPPVLIPAAVIQMTSIVRSLSRNAFKSALATASSTSYSSRIA